MLHDRHLVHATAGSAQRWTTIHVYMCQALQTCLCQCCYVGQVHLQNGMHNKADACHWADKEAAIGAAVNLEAMAKMFKQYSNKVVVDTQR